jgi:hypothetical protein
VVSALKQADARVAERRRLLEGSIRSDEFHAGLEEVAASAGDSPFVVDLDQHCPEQSDQSGGVVVGPRNRFDG